MWHMGGAVARVGAGDTAFGDRSAPYLLEISSSWDDPRDSDENIGWTRSFWSSMQQHSSGGLYLNFQVHGEPGEDPVRAAYGDNYARLAAIKTKYDPDNLFRMNQNIQPD